MYGRLQPISEYSNFVYSTLVLGQIEYSECIVKKCCCQFRIMTLDTYTKSVKNIRMQTFVIDGNNAIPLF